jgi:energy-converting hydrogenase Eha subunit A
MTPARPIPRKLPARYGALVMPLILSGMMTVIISGISTVNALGFTPVVLHDWPRAWLISWAVAFPTLLAVLPVVRRLTALVVEREG